MDLFCDYRERGSDSPLVERVQQARVGFTGSTIRPAEIHWHMVLARYRGEARVVLAGPLTSSGVVSVPEGAEILWIKLKLGAFMPHLPARHMLDTETTLPGAASNSFWLHGSAWQFPDYENVDTFVSRLAAEEVLVHDPLVNEVLTGLTQGQIRQFERAQRAASVLQQGATILDTVFEAGYSDQPHLTRSLKRWIGHTPAQLTRPTVPG
jgi:hypothetical protein